MNAEKSRILIDLEKSGSFSSTAENLGYTPSGISRAVEAAEAEAGFPLVVRSSRGVSLTEGCRALLKILREIAFWDEQYNQSIQQLNGLVSGTVQVGTSYPEYFSKLSDIILGFHEKYPGVIVNIAEGTSSELSERMDNLNLDFALVSKREGKHRFFRLFFDDLVALLPEKHALSAEKSVPHAIFRDEPFIEIFPDKETDNSIFFRRESLVPNVRFTVSDSSAAFAMVRVGLGISLVNRQLISNMPDGIVSLPLDPPEKIEFGVIIPEKNTITPAAKRFAGYALERLKDRA